MVYRQLPCLSFSTLASWFENEHTAECNLLLWSEPIMAADSVLYYERRCLLTESCGGEIFKQSERVGRADPTQNAMLPIRSWEQQKKKKDSNRERERAAAIWWAEHEYKVYRCKRQDCFICISVGCRMTMIMMIMMMKWTDYFSIFSLLQQLYGTTQLIMWQMRWSRVH